ncbi:uncharacterized protein LOC116801252 [Drosophila sechellia]|uniref:uncharacterized protein LOC116801252 n=1 Tax=Drosophila sechellia TaxID=7238 RepID=UPI0013DE6CDF|nr:uncharacterized protein LOC116801252 [Drosophila sechellia]
MLLVLVVLQFISFTYGSEMNNKTYSGCEAMTAKDEPNLAIVFQCLVANYNLSATLSDIMIKMDQFQQEKYVQSPFQKIDDILEISSDLSGKDCQSRRQIIQAIRRKLEWYNVMDDTESSLFDYDDAIKPEISESAPENAVSKIELRTDFKKVLKEIRCLLAKSIRKTEPTANATETN